MRFHPTVLVSCVLLATVRSLDDGCPKDELACHDVMNSSQCIAQLVIDKLAPATRENLIKCVEYEGTVTNIPGATKYCRCLGCHTPAINAVLSELFPPPCS